MAFDWGDEMSVGVEVLDVQHRQVWRRIRHLANAVSDGETDEVRAALRFLHGYLLEHHAEEERWMAEGGYPGALEHARGHAAIVARIHTARGDEGGSAKRLLEAAAWVARALHEHMRAEDLKLARFFTARENLRRLAEEGPGVGAALTPIPGMARTVRREPGAATDGPDPVPAPDASRASAYPATRSSPRTRK